MQIGGNVDMNSSNVLKGFRGKRLLTQDDVAKKLGVSRQVYNNYENDLVHCELDLVMKILYCLVVSEDEIMEFLSALKQDIMSYKANQEEEE